MFIELSAVQSHNENGHGLLPEPEFADMLIKDFALNAHLVEVPHFLLVFFVRFSAGLVRFYIAGLPLRSCPDHWATFCEGVLQCFIFVSGISRIRTHVLDIAMQTCYRCATLTPNYGHALALNTIYYCGIVRMEILLPISIDELCCLNAGY